MSTAKTKKLIPVDITLDGVYSGKDPFVPEVTGEFVSDKGEKLVIPGFYRGKGKWSVRFSAEEEGDWTFRIYSDKVKLKGELSGLVEVKGEQPGVNHMLRTKGTRFVDSAGRPVFLLGFECNFLFSMVASPNGHEKLATLVKNIKEGGFNQVQINTYAVDSSWFKGRYSDNDYGPPYIDLWNKTDEGRQLNPAFFDNYDYMIKYLHENGIYAHIYLKVYNKYVELPEKYSDEETTYYYNFVARYQAYSNIIWDISKEGYYEIDKDYFYAISSKVRTWDAYKHLHTIHDDLILSLDKKYSDTVDFLTIQQHGECAFASKYFIERSGKPVVLGESGNEIDASSPLSSENMTVEDYCSQAYSAIMSGAYFQYYNLHTSWDVIEYDKIPKGYRYFRQMRDFFSQFEFEKFKNVHELAARGAQGEYLDDGESTLLVFIEPAKKFPYHAYTRGGIAPLNPAYGRKFISYEAYGIYSGTTTSVEPLTHFTNLNTYELMSDEVKKHLDTGEHTALKDNIKLKCLREEPTVFVIKYKKAK